MARSCKSRSSRASALYFCNKIATIFIEDENESLPEVNKTDVILDYGQFGDEGESLFKKLLKAHWISLIGTVTALKWLTEADVLNPCT